MIHLFQFSIRPKSKSVGTIAFFLLIVLSFFDFPAMAQEYLSVNGAIIMADIKKEKEYNIAIFLQKEIYKRTNLKLPISKKIPSREVAIVLGLDNDISVPGNLKLAQNEESYAIWVENKKNRAPAINVVGASERGLLFGTGKLILELNLSNDFISVSKNLALSDSPADKIRAQQIITNVQGEDGFVQWDDANDIEQFVNDMVIFGANGFEPTRPELIDSYLESLGLDLFIKLKCQDIIDLNNENEESIQDYFKELKGVDYITTYGGDASGAVKPQLFFPYMERVIPLVLQGQPGSKWWYSNQCLEDHTQSFDDYIFNFINQNQPDYLHGLVYGPWTRRGITEIRDDLPQQYVIRHFPDICHPRWCQYPVPKWDRAFAMVWPRNKSIYAMPSMMLDIYKATRENTVGSLPYNHTGAYNDLNKFVWAAAGWNPKTNVETILSDYAKAFFAHDFLKLPEGISAEGLSKEEFLSEATDYVAEGLKLLELNWVGHVKNNQSIEEALDRWVQISNCVGGPNKNWRVEMFLYKARSDAQIKRKHDLEMQIQNEVDHIIANSEGADLRETTEKVKSVFEKAENGFQSKDAFLKELQAIGLTKKFGDLNEIVDNIYTPFNDMEWTIEQLEDAENYADLLKIVNYENPGPGGFYDNLGVEGEQPHLFRQKSWAEDPGFVYSPIEWVDNKTNSDNRHSQHTHMLSRYNTPLMMRWENLDPNSEYEIMPVYNGPFDIKIKCEADQGILIHDFIEKTGSHINRFPIPAAAIKNGQLHLQWTQDPTTLKRGVSLSEVWLVKKEK
jgi:hypothetical protein